MSRADQTLVVVDIQREYADSFEYFLEDFVDFVNESASEFKKVIFMHNGEELGMSSVNEQIYFLSEIGIREDVIHNIIKVRDKTYGFLRSFMDQGVDDEDLIKIVRKMEADGISDSRDIEEPENLDIDSAAIELIGSGDSIYIPDIMDTVENLDNVLICGGGRYECLKEIEILMDIAGVEYETLDSFIY